MRHAQSKNEPRIFHYTVIEDYKQIVEDGLIRPATKGVPTGERPAVWFSIYPLWEPTASKGLEHPETGEVQRATWSEMQELGPVRIEVAPDAAPHHWIYSRSEWRGILAGAGVESKGGGAIYAAAVTSSQGRDDGTSRGRATAELGR